MVELIKKVFIKSYIFYLFTGYFSSYNRNWKFLAFFFTKVWEKSSIFGIWYYGFTQTHMFLVLFY